MGRRNHYREPELQSVPQISYRSKRLASASRKRKVDGRSKQKNQGNIITGLTLNTYDKGVPNYMQNTIARRESIVLPPIQRFEITKKLYAKSRTNSISSTNSGLDSPSRVNNILFLSAPSNKELSVDERIMARAAAITRRSSYDENPFTFKPKVSSASVRIVEGLGSDFMTRQQQHIEKQKKNLEQANQHYLDQIKTTRKAGSPVDKISAKKSESFDASSDSKEDMKQPVSTSQSNTSVDVSKSSRMVSNQGLSRLENSPYGSVGVNLLNKQKTKIANFKKRQNTTFIEMNQQRGNNENRNTDRSDSVNDQDGDPEHISHSRSKTVPPGKMSNRVSELNLDRVKNAKLMAERAIRNRKVFTIQGPYPSIRASLRRRGWVERFYKAQGPAKKIPKTVRKSNDDDNNNDDDDDDGDDDDNNDDYVADEKVKPWEEEDGIYGIMSRIARNSTPTFVWCIRRDAVDFRFVSKDQMVNHYCRAGSFTTKAGLCTNIRNVHWFYDADPDTFFPRSYKLSGDDEKMCFIEDYRLSACMNIVKWVIYKHDEDIEDGGAEEEMTEEKSEENEVASSADDTTSRRKKTKGGIVPMKCIDMAFQQCERWIRYKDNEDIDHWEDPYEISDAQWDQLIQWSYQLTQEDGLIPDSKSRLAECRLMAGRLRRKLPQFDMDGMKNIWIVKPGAKSRGRGIMVMGRLDEILKLAGNSGVMKKEGKLVVQKYIERPLLIYNTKFDIRQWFLVTDWNPLTLWFYKDCYFRFCTQQFTLDDYNVAIHLCNNSIQKHYTNGPRSSHLPQDNMWDNDQFNDYLRRRGHGDVWEKVIYPGMKQAVLSALLCSQDLVEYRKSSFELYGADFMITEDFQPWLIEINCSPTMAPSTKITSRMCANVQEDTIKIVIDRKFDKTCDTGRFELAYKQSVVDIPPYIGLCLSVEGQAIRKPGALLTNRRNTCASLDIVNEVNFNQSKEQNKERDVKTALKTSPYLSSCTTVNQTNPNRTLPFTYTKPNNVKSPTQSSSTTSTNTSKKDSTISITTSKSVTKKDSSSSVLTAASRSRENNALSSSVQTRPIPEREKFPLRLTNVDALDLKQALSAPKGSLVVDGSWAQICAKCGNSQNGMFHYDNEHQCKCHQHDSVNTTSTTSTIGGGVKSKRCKSARTPYSPRTMTISPRPPSSRAVPRDHILAAVYKRGSCGFEPRSTTRRSLKYTDAGIQVPPLYAATASRTVTHAFPSLTHRSGQQMKSLALGAGSLYHTSHRLRIRQSLV